MAQQDPVPVVDPPAPDPQPQPADVVYSGEGGDMGDDVCAARRSAAKRAGTIMTGPSRRDW